MIPIVFSPDTVAPEEKANLLAAIAEADRGGSLPYDAAMAEVRRKSDEILDVLASDAAPVPPAK